MNKKYIIDPKIRDLVVSMNIYGFETYASCHGHGFPVRKQYPYIAFRSPLSRAKVLAQLIRNDAESDTPQLMWGWEVAPLFNEVFSLCFRLSPTAPRRYYYRYWRGTLDHDFSKIILMMENTFQKFQRIKNIKVP
ncbi:hypothetical protein ACK1C0_002774 [Salmonella enterica]